MSQGDLVVVQSYGTEGEAEVAKGVLESSGIDAMIQADTAARTSGMERPGTSGACARRGRIRGAKPSCLASKR